MREKCCHALDAGGRLCEIVTGGGDRLALCNDAIDSIVRIRTLVLIRISYCSFRLSWTTLTTGARGDDGHPLAWGMLAWIPSNAKFARASS